MKKPAKLIKLLVICGLPIGCLAAWFIFGAIFYSLVDDKSVRIDRGPSLEEFRTGFIASVDEDLANPENFLRKKIENAHWTVKTTSARVTACSVFSVDGTDRAGKNNENIAEIDLVLTFFWDGLIQKGGYTELRITVDGRTRQIKSSKYVGGNAQINVGDIDWIEIGKEAAPYVLSFMVGGG